MRSLNYITVSKKETLSTKQSNAVNAEIKDNELSIYPNPNTGEFKIRYDFEPNSTLRIVNNLGQAVKVIQPTNNQLTITLEGVSKGMYTVFIINDKAKIVSSKLIIQ